ncbi:uncharacterized protein LAJ45_10541 [Morchella importuna]|uniref:uncharacterized protein n=1 Tax=Morchella importuna TaxID=1174673 RepID=UPI001E8DA81D|nr:uncharacterized protein LAJ45_10541 [Morchella importuna]KAH8145419.1 hypothetical protein LAJ45_10541 [Morchella importuna]
MSNTEPYHQCLQDIRSRMTLYLLPNTLPYELLTALLNAAERDYLYHRTTAENVAESPTESNETPAPGSVAEKKPIITAAGRMIIPTVGTVDGVKRKVWVEV